MTPLFSESNRFLLDMSHRLNMAFTSSRLNGSPAPMSYRYKRNTPHINFREEVFKGRLRRLASLIEVNPGSFNRVLTRSPASSIDDLMDRRRNHVENRDTDNIRSQINHLSDSFSSAGYNDHVLYCLIPFVRHPLALCELVYGKTARDVGYHDVILKLREIADGDIIQFCDELQAKLAKGVP